MSHGAHRGGQPQPTGMRPDQQPQYNAGAEPQRDFLDGWEVVMAGEEAQAPETQRPGQHSSQGQGASSRQSQGASVELAGGGWSLQSLRRSRQQGAGAVRVNPDDCKTQ